MGRVADGSSHHLRFALRPVVSLRYREAPSPCQREPGGDRVNDGRAGKIREPKRFQPAFAKHQTATGPRPMPKYRVNQEGQNCHQIEVGAYRQPIRQHRGNSHAHNHG